MAALTVTKACATLSISHFASAQIASLSHAADHPR